MDLVRDGIEITGDGVPTLAGSTGGLHLSAACEWQIDLCNRIGADLWVNISARTNWDYSYQLALLLKQHLDPDLKIVEWSLEVWN